MATLNVAEASSILYSLIDEANSTHQPIVIIGKSNNAVLLLEEDWNAISETLYLLSVLDMRESIVDGMSEPVEDCSSELDW